MTASRRKELLKNLSLSAGSLLLFVALLEGVLRWCGYGSLVIYQPDPQLYWKPKPDQDCYTKLGHKPVHINSHGTRGPDFPTIKPRGTVRVVSLGDSRTFGWGLTDGETYSRRLEALLRRRVRPPRRVEVINAGVNAWSFPQMAVYFRDDALRFQPDFVIVEGANLWTQFTEDNDPRFVREFMGRVRLKNFLRHFALYHYFIEVQLRGVYERYRTRFIPVDPRRDTLFKGEQKRDATAVFQQAILTMCRMALRHGVKPILLYLPTRTELREGKPGAIWRVKKEIARQLHIAFVDLTPDLAPRGKALYLKADPVHLDAAGNRIVARRLFETIAPLLPP